MKLKTDTKIGLVVIFFLLMTIGLLIGREIVRHG